jgi:hypothetical protein
LKPLLDGHTGGQRVGFRGKHHKKPVTQQLDHAPLVLSNVLLNAEVSCVTKRDAVASPKRSKMPVLPTKSAKTTVVAWGVSVFHKSIKEMVGVAGFELATPCTPCKCATRLRYTPTSLRL